MATVLGSIHEKVVFNRRVQVLAEHLAAVAPENGTILDVGCGDGSIDQLIMRHRPGIAIHGIDIMERPKSHIPMKVYDGAHFPHPDQSFDAVSFVDVLHHTPDPRVLLKEAKRVGKSILIKDHFRDGFMANATLAVMDWVGNAPHGVVLPYNYWSRAEWTAAYDDLGLKVDEIRTSLGLYPAPLSWFFERGLHFVVRLLPR